MLILYELSLGLLACLGCLKDKEHCGGLCDCGWCSTHPSELLTK